jgi:hypothetical protein
VNDRGTALAAAAQLPLAGQQYDDAHNQIWIQSVGNRTTQDLGLHQLDALQSCAPDWSPNDRFIVFESNRGCVSGSYAISVEAAVGGAARRDGIGLRRSARPRVAVRAGSARWELHVESRTS